MHLKKTSLIIAVTCLLLATAPIQTQAVIIDRIVAVVNGEITTLSELQELEYSLNSEMGEKNKTPELTSALLDKLIDKKLKLQLAIKKNISVSEQQLQEATADIKQQNNLTSDKQLEQALASQGMTLENFIRQLKENIQITILIKKEVTSRIEISEKEINDYYLKHRAYFDALNELRAQHILFYLPNEPTAEETRAKEKLANEVWEKLKQGEDFGKLAKEFSDDPSAKKGGDLGFFKKGEMLPVLEQAAFKLKNGEISPVLKSNLGFHIIKLLEHREHTPENDPKIKQEIQQSIYSKKSEEALTKWMEKLRKEAKIKKML